MTLFLSLFPIFIFGNLHCAGMCGPLVMLLAHHPYRWYYFVGRLLSFTCAGVVAAEMGVWLFTLLHRFHIAAFVSLLFGAALLVAAGAQLLQRRLINLQWLKLAGAGSTTLLVQLIRSPAPWAPFLFGLATLLLPCGQTLLVFSMIALYANPLLGFLHGALFALFTSISLAGVLLTARLVRRPMKAYPYLMGGALFLAGLLSLLRGLADLELIDHLVLNPRYHIVLY